jgi:hypothetical protein
MQRWSAGEVGLLVEQRAGSSAPLDRLTAAVDLVDEMRSVGDEVLDRFVAEARAAECSWTEVGPVLGVSKQVAQQRFPAGGPAAALAGRVTATVRAAMVVAQDESRALGHNYIGNEHLLLGLLAQTDALAADVLAGLGVTREAIVVRTREIVARRRPAAGRPSVCRRGSSGHSSWRARRPAGSGIGAWAYCSASRASTRESVRACCATRGTTGPRSRGGRHAAWRRRCPARAAAAPPRPAAAPLIVDISLQARGAARCALLIHCSLRAMRGTVV